MTVFNDVMRPRILYFNLTYFCDNDCRFCFSHSTGNNARLIDYQELISRIDKFRLTKNDVVVINGGEPSLHPQFESIVGRLLTLSPARVRVYSNGRNLRRISIDSNPRLSFIVPIHGNRRVHDFLTQRDGSYAESIEALQSIQLLHHHFAVKFILTPELVESHFSIINCLNECGLRPDEVFFARLNDTLKSRRNGCRMLPPQYLKEFVAANDQSISCGVKYLDIPPCCIASFPADGIAYNAECPDFFFCDDKMDVTPRIYLKKLKIVDGCDDCKWRHLCDIMERSYLTLARADKKWMLEVE